MIERRVAGKVPRKHHIQLRDEQGRLMHEECITRDGFEGPCTCGYHQRAPQTRALAEVGHGWKAPEAIAARGPLAKRHYRTQELEPVGGTPVGARVPLLFNADVTLGVMPPTPPSPPPAPACGCPSGGRQWYPAPRRRRG